MKLSLRLLLGTILVGFSAAATAQVTSFFDIAQIDRDAIEMIERDEPFVVERAPGISLDATTAPTSPDPTLARATAQLGLDGEALLAVPVTRGAAPPGRAHRIEFRMAGQWLRMLAIESRPDPDFDVVHMTLLAPFSDDFARLTISRSGPEIVGTVVVGDRRFRLLPDEFNPEYQLVYAVAPRAGGWTRENAPNLETRAGQLEARHLQMAWVADNQPRVFLTYSDGRLRDYADGPNLGVLNFWDAVAFDPAGNGSVDADILTAETSRYLTEAQRLTWIYERVEVQLEPRFETDMTRLTSRGIGIELNQLINGIPISRPLLLDIGPTGEVNRFSGTLMRTSMAETNYGARIVQQEARDASVLALFSRHGIESNGEFTSEELLYNVISDTELDLIYRMSLVANCGMTFIVEIDAITGEVRTINGIDPNPSQADFARRFNQNDPFFRCRYQNVR